MKFYIYYIVIDLCEGFAIIRVLLIDLYSVQFELAASAVQES